MEPEETAGSVIAGLQYLRDLPVTEFETRLDDVLLQMAGLRDELAERSRKEPDNMLLRQRLQQVDCALSLICGPGFPESGFLRHRTARAIEVLKGIGAESEEEIKEIEAMIDGHE